MPGNQNLLNEGEYVVIETHTHFKALFGAALIGLLILAGAITLTVIGSGAVVMVAWGAAALLALWFVLRPILIWMNTTYTFTNRRFISRSGIIAKEGRTIPLNRISGVDFEIGVIDRIFGCGTLIVSDASTEGRVEVRDIPNVEEVQLKVAEELHRRASRSDDGS